MPMETDDSADNVELTSSISQMFPDVVGRENQLQSSNTVLDKPKISLPDVREIEEDFPSYSCSPITSS